MGFGALGLIVLISVIQDKFSYGTCVYFGEEILNEYGATRAYTIKYCELLAFSLSPLLLFIPLSLITYRMKDEVFQAWWRFARWFVPVIIAVTLFVQNAGGGGGWGMNGGAFDAFFIGIFYVIFIITSLVKIFNAYLKTKGN